jgi:hypothetical protein
MIVRDGGYFSSLKPTDTPLLSKALRHKKTGNKERPIDFPMEAARVQDKGKGKAREDVVLEKSNVLMMYVFTPDSE